MCSTFFLLVIEWKLCAHTTSDVQTSKLAQRYTILACCWYQWCEYCRFVIFQLVFPEIFTEARKQYWHQFLSFDMFYFLSFGYRVETECTHYKQRTNIKTCTTLYYISVLLVSVVWILSICHFPTVFPEIFMSSSKSNIDISFWASMCSTFSLLVIEWKLSAHTTSDVQTSKLAQCYTILQYSRYHWCEYCRFVIFQLFFLKIFVKSSKSNVYISIYELRCVLLSLFWLSSGNCAHTLQATYKHQNFDNVILY